MHAPCRDCPKKGCGSYHDKCPEYIEYRKERDKIYEERKRVSINETNLDALDGIRIWRRKKANTRLKQR